MNTMAIGYGDPEDVSMTAIPRREFLLARLEAIQAIEQKETTEKDELLGQEVVDQVM